MMTPVRRLLAVGLSAVLLTGALQTSADARAIPRVGAPEATRQDWCGSTIRVRWPKVAGATYQVRWARTKSGLKSARVVSVRRPKAAVGPLSVAGDSYVQVRAIRHGKAGSWSKKRAVRFSRKPLDKPRLGGIGVANGVRFQWPCTANASRYRVRWAAAPHGLWPATTNLATGWLSQTARGATFPVASSPRAGDYMLSVAYANPVWARLEAGNPYGATRLSTGWTPVFPAPPSPGTGDRLRLGSYNVMLSPVGARAAAIAANISSHGVTVAALQEANLDSVRAVVAALGSGWAYAPSGQDSAQQIIYRKSAYLLAGSGTFSVPNPKSPSSPLVTPWARLTPTTSAQPGHGRPLFLVSAHLTTDTAKSALQQKRDSGTAAQVIMNAVAGAKSAGDAVVVAGDFQNLREPFGDVAGYVEAPPTFVRGGYYDAMAAIRKVNIAYSTVNGGGRQSPAGPGVASRTDYIMLQGFRSSRAYVNVANWTYNGTVPSDHNLVYADLTVPFA